MTAPLHRVTLWAVKLDGDPESAGLHNLRVWEDAAGFRDSPGGRVLVHRVEGEPLYPWRRSRLEAVSAYVERRDHDLKALHDRQRMLRAEMKAALQLLTAEDLDDIARGK